ADNAALGSKWRFTLRYLWEFLGIEALLLNPVFFLGTIWAITMAWKKRRENPLLLYLFCLGAPVFLGHFAYSLHSRIQPNWIAAAVVPLFTLAVIYWYQRWQSGSAFVKHWFAAGVTFGFLVLIPMHESNLIGKLAGHPLPGEMDPLRRVRAWKE